MKEDCRADEAGDDRADKADGEGLPEIVDGKWGVCCRKPANLSLKSLQITVADPVIYLRNKTCR